MAADQKSESVLIRVIRGLTSSTIPSTSCLDGIPGWKTDQEYHKIRGNGKLVSSEFPPAWWPWLMAIRSNHYDAAFEEFLRTHRAPHVVVDEQRRSLLPDGSLKSMDFIVYSQRTTNLLVDVKGRRFPSGAASAGHKWENWTTTDDLASLQRWEDVFGGDFRSLLVFAYHVSEFRWLREHAAPFQHRNRVYAFYGVWADDYRRAMRNRSAKWETVSVPSAEFRSLRKPIAEFL